MSEQNNLEAMEEAMVIIQKSLKTIKTTASKFDEMESNSREVLDAMTQLTTKVTSLEAKIGSSEFQGKQDKKIDVPLYIKV